MYAIIQNKHVDFVKNRPFLCSLAGHEVTRAIEKIKENNFRRPNAYTVMAVNLAGEAIEYCRADKWREPDLRKGPITTESEERVSD